MPAVQATAALINGPIWCGQAEGFVEALAIWRNRVLAAGSRAEINALIGDDTHVVDLEGRLATPGLNDAHMHLLPLGVGMAEIDLRVASGVTTLDGLLRRVAERVATAAPGAWVLGRGYDHFELDVGRHPTRDELDRVAPDHPVYLVRTCGHVAVANSKAFELAGVDEATPVPAGGAIERKDGRLTGLMAENGRAPVQAVLPVPDEDALVEAIERAGRYCLSLGITSVMDAAVGIRAGWAEIPAYFRAKREGRLPVRTYQCLLGGPGGVVEQAYAAGLLSGTGDDMLMLGAVKIFTDGSAGGRTAAMVRPYEGGGDEHGIFCLTDAECEALVMDYHAKGYRMAIHAIGDAAIEQTLRAYEKALDARPAPDRRHRIEHCGWLSDEQMARMVKRGVEPVPQPVFMYDFGDLYVSVLGEERTVRAYPMRSWVNAGQHPAASSDAPVCDANPFPNLYTMVTRKTSKGTTLGGQEALEMAEALTAYTAYGAYVTHEEDTKGRLVPGHLADIAVWSKDLFRVPPETVLRHAQCDLTLLGGRVVFDRYGQAGG
ncbi:amidohydrolase [Marinivivus vitaminiproducens]|uniref:amidohydrolase n=1 Tax=Marinivivus vitaminiproducens TaxID=3035935 RepID=UPI002799D641|nr:amidohydrolase [Geminicoccaceae bacterium SCSIO 64248]